MKVAKAQSGIAINYLCAFVPSKSSQIWTILKNKANFAGGEKALSSLKTI